MFFDRPISPEAVWNMLPPKLLEGEPWIYGTDGKWLKRHGVIVVHRDITNKENLFWSWNRSESYSAYATDLKLLSQLLDGNTPSGAVSDWLGAICAAIASYFGNILHQRCLTHVVRQAKNLLPKKSGYKAVVELRSIAKQLIQVESEEQKRQWLKELIRWEKQYEHMLKEKTMAVGNTKRKWWYTHGNLRRAWRILTNNWNPFFVHLYNSMIPHSNNSLEGTIGQMKNKLINHRGMKLPQQISFLFWYLTFTRVKTRHDLKKLWDVWKIVQ